MHVTIPIFKLVTCALYRQSCVVLPRISIPNSPEAARLWTVISTFLTIQVPYCSTFLRFCRYLKLKIYVLTHYNFICRDIVIVLQIYKTISNIFFIYHKLSREYALYPTLTIQKLSGVKWICRSLLLSFLYESFPFEMPSFWYVPSTDELYLSVAPVEVMFN